MAYSKMKLLAKIYEKVSNAWYRMRLKNDNFTIITNTCIAGVMYHKLGKQFLSPTINLWMEDEDFFKFVHNIEYYLAQPLVFIPRQFGSPAAKIDDVILYFNHYKTEDEAEVKWNERKRRVNMDNLFIICSDRPSPITGKVITHEDILSLRDIPCRGKVVFSTQSYDDVDYIVPLPKDSEGDYVNVYMLDKSKYLKRWRWESAWDWVRWLNDGIVRIKE